MVCARRLCFMEGPSGRSTLFLYASSAQLVTHITKRIPLNFRNFIYTGHRILLSGRLMKLTEDIFLFIPVENNPTERLGALRTEGI